MKEVYSHEFFVQKAYELSYALFRLAEKARGVHSSLADRLEANALDLLNDVVGGKFSGAQKTLLGIHYFLRVGGDAGALNPSHVRMIVAEAEKLNSAIEDSNNSAKEENPAEIFSEWNSNSNNYQFLPELAVQDSKNPARELYPETIGESENSKNKISNERTVEERLSAIVGRIRQNGNCRMKEIQESLPDVSERTIRYDLQKLLERGALERVGSGGPATFYRTREEGVAL